MVDNPMDALHATWLDTEMMSNLQLDISSNGSGLNIILKWKGIEVAKKTVSKIEFENYDYEQSKPISDIVRVDGSTLKIIREDP